MIYKRNSQLKWKEGGRGGGGGGGGGGRERPWRP